MLRTHGVPFASGTASRSSVTSGQTLRASQRAREVSLLALPADQRPPLGQCRILGPGVTALALSIVALQTAEPVELAVAIARRRAEHGVFAEYDWEDTLAISRAFKADDDGRNRMGKKNTYCATDTQRPARSGRRSRASRAATPASGRSPPWAGCGWRRARRQTASSS